MENLVVMPTIDREFWRGKRVFLTGHTGFKGSWLSLFLVELGAIVRGYAMDPPTHPSLFLEANVKAIIDSEIGDIRDFQALKKSMLEFEPEILIHMAAQPIVHLSYEMPLETYDINVNGTVKVLEIARSCSTLRAIVNVTTDKVYENSEIVWGYREVDPIGGHDPYASSKACVELLTSAYRRSFMEGKGVGLATARAGNVIGGGDWADYRLIPDVLRAFENNQPVTIRNPSSVRPWQHVLEPLSGYLILAQYLYREPKNYAEGWNFGPFDEDAKTVEWILRRMVEKWEGASWIIDQEEHPHETNYLKLDISKARAKLHWEPTWSLENTLTRIIKWHRHWLGGEDMQKICLAEIQEFLTAMSGVKN